MPRSLVLLTAGENTLVNLPSTAQECCSRWHHDLLFPVGVTLHRMMHLPRELARDIGILSHLSRNYVETVSLSLLIDKRLENINTVSSFMAAGGDCIPPNFHEIPKLLDTQLFYGNLLVILTIDGTTILPFDMDQYRKILKNQYPINPSSSSFHHSMSAFSTTPTNSEQTTSASDPMSISAECAEGIGDFFPDDEVDFESMDISDDVAEGEGDIFNNSLISFSSDDEKTPISSRRKSGRHSLKFLDICLKSKTCSLGIPRPIRPVF